MRPVSRRCFVALCAAAAFAPMIGWPAPTTRHVAPAWPEQFEGARLYPVPVSSAERAFYADFPGAAARFTDGRRDLIFRWVSSGTRKLHSASDCFRGLGYTVSPAPPELDSHGDRWSCFTASRGTHHLRVRERILSLDQSASWTDVSAWYWATLLRSSRGPWLAITVAEPAAE
jgi:hypothetical protein